MQPCMCRKEFQVVNAVHNVEKEPFFFFCFVFHLLELLLKIVFGDLVPYNWILPRGECLGESLKQIYVAVSYG